MFKFIKALFTSPRCPVCGHRMKKSKLSSENAAGLRIVKYVCPACWTVIRRP